MNATTDPADATLLGVLQETIPFSRRPFAGLGERCGLTEDEVLARVMALKENKVIRQISAIFDTRSLGYASSLVAAKIAPEKLDDAVAVINSHPGVSHNYLRNHEFNLWYTIAVPPTSRLGLEKTVELAPPAVRRGNAPACCPPCGSSRSVCALMSKARQNPATSLLRPTPSRTARSRPAHRRGNRVRPHHAARPPDHRRAVCGDRGGTRDSRSTKPPPSTNNF